MMRSYDLKGLNAIRRALRRAASSRYGRRGRIRCFPNGFAPAGFDVNEVAVRATTKRSGARHLIWFATKP